jgi:hypothetical protein
MAQPIDIPILFEPKDLPKIDFSQISRNTLQAVQRIRQENQAKEQYRQAQNARMWNEFKNVVDIDKPLAITRESQERQAKVIEGWSNSVAEAYANSNGAPNQQELVRIEQSAQKIEDQLARQKVWEQNWLKDRNYIKTNLDKVDLERAQEIYNYDFNTPYDSSKIKLKDVSGMQIATNTRREFLSKDSADRLTITTGGKFKDSFEFYKEYYNVDSQGKPLSLDYNAIKDFNDKAVFSDGYKTQSLMNEFDKLNEVDQRRYTNMAENGDESRNIEGTGIKEDAVKYYYLDKYSNDVFGLKEQRTQLTPKTSGDGYRNGYRYIKGSYQLDESQGITFKSPQGEYSSNNYYAMPGTNRSGIINEPIDMDRGEDLGKSLTLPVGSTHKLIGVDYDPATGEKMNHYQVKFPTQDLTKDGKIVYTSPRYGDGTEEELKEKYLDEARNNQEYLDAKPKNKKKLDTRYLGDWGFVVKDLEPKKERAHTRNIYAPAKNNPVDAKKYKVTDEPKIEVKETTYTIKGVDYPVEAITKAAEQSGLSVDEYIKRANE